MKKFLLLLFVSSYTVFTTAQTVNVCAGNSATIVGSGVGTATLFPGNIPPNTSGNWVVNPSSTTTYTIASTVNGNTTYSSVTMAVKPKPLVSPSFTQATCTNSTNCFNLHLTFFPSNPAPSYTVLWGNPGQPTPSIPNGINSSFQFSLCGAIAPGAYEAIIFAEGGCSVTTQFTMLPVPAPADFGLFPPGNTLSITCTQPLLTISADNTNNTYTWSSVSMAPVNGQSVALNSTNQGVLTVSGENSVSGCTSSKTISIGVNTVVPALALTPTLQNITCLSPALTHTLVAISPTVNISLRVISPQNGVFVSNFSPSYYTPGGPGTYTYVLRNEVNGCESLRQFSVTSTDNFPSYTLSPSPDFTLGCSTKSVVTITIPTLITLPSPGQPITVQYFAPGSGTLTGTTQTINTPGSWTVSVKDNSNNCITRCPFSVLQNTLAPVVTVTTTAHVLTCDVPSATLSATSDVTGASIIWYGNIGTTPGNTAAINANLAVPTSTLVGDYTVSVVNPVNMCAKQNTISVLQNVFPPLAKITSPLTNPCVPPNITLTNASNSTIPPAFPHPLPAIGLLWEAPAPQPPMQNSTTYVATVPGIYTLTAKDLNNGCVSKGTFLVEACLYSSVSSNLNEDSRILVYPNPNNGYVTISFDLEIEAVCKAELLNTLGQTVKVISPSVLKQAGQVNINAELEGLNSGIYFLRIQTGSQEHIKKLTISH